MFRKLLRVSLALLLAAALPAAVYAEDSGWDLLSPDDDDDGSILVDDGSGSSDTSSSKEESKDASKDETPAPTRNWDVYVNGFVITVRGVNLDQLTEVSYHGRVLERGYEYTAHNGSVVIELKSFFLRYLPAGHHTLHIEFNNNTYAEATFSIRDQRLETTGDQWDDYIYNEDTPLPLGSEVEMEILMESPPNVNMNPGTGR